eukprot:TRINITY_DN10483_c0_g2_i1.p1 TRINITY_DN10483_c0_g2~~TRINITY_DN10483_c0_g2_i1.p1  ORF type:complete len:1100 (+),score=185.70 TRINITY_DN10483_c0_g2_i1:80-3379(+)
MSLASGLTGRGVSLRPQRERGSSFARSECARSLPSVPDDGPADPQIDDGLSLAEMPSPESDVHSASKALAAYRSPFGDDSSEGSVDTGAFRAGTVAQGDSGVEGSADLVVGGLRPFEHGGELGPIPAAPPAGRPRHLSEPTLSPSARRTPRERRRQSLPAELPRRLVEDRQLPADSPQHRRRQSSPTVESPPPRRLSPGGQRGPLMTPGVAAHLLAPGRDRGQQNSSRRGSGRRTAVSWTSRQSESDALAVPRDPRGSPDRRSAGSNRSQRTSVIDPRLLYGKGFKKRRRGRGGDLDDDSASTAGSQRHRGRRQSITTEKNAAEEASDSDSSGGDAAPADPMQWTSTSPRGGPSEEEHRKRDADTSASFAHLLALAWRQWLQDGALHSAVAAVLCAAAASAPAAVAQVRNGTPRRARKPRPMPSPPGLGRPQAGSIPESTSSTPAAAAQLQEDMKEVVAALAAQLVNEPRETRRLLRELRNTELDRTLAERRGRRSARAQRLDAARRQRFSWEHNVAVLRRLQEMQHRTERNAAGERGTWQRVVDSCTADTLEILAQDEERARFAVRGMFDAERRALSAAFAVRSCELRIAELDTALRVSHAAERAQCAAERLRKGMRRERRGLFRLRRYARLHAETLATIRRLHCLRDAAKRAATDGPGDAEKRSWVDVARYRCLELIDFSVGKKWDLRRPLSPTGTGARGELTAQDMLQALPYLLSSFADTQRNLEDCAKHNSWPGLPREPGAIGTVLREVLALQTTAMAGHEDRLPSASESGSESPTDSDYNSGDLASATMPRYKVDAADAILLARTPRAPRPPARVAQDAFRKELERVAQNYGKAIQDGEWPGQDPYAHAPASPRSPRAQPAGADAAQGDGFMWLEVVRDEAMHARRRLLAGLAAAGTAALAIIWEGVLAAQEHRARKAKLVQRVTLLTAPAAACAAAAVCAGLRPQRLPLGRPAPSGRRGTSTWHLAAGCPHLWPLSLVGAAAPPPRPPSGSSSRPSRRRTQLQQQQHQRVSRHSTLLLSASTTHSQQESVCSLPTPGGVDGRPAELRKRRRKRIKYCPLPSPRTPNRCGSSPDSASPRSVLPPIAPSRPCSRR